MKKFVLVLLALIAVLAIILYFKMNGNISANSPTPTPEAPISSLSNVSNSSDFSTPSSSSGYSSEDIEKLILKGKETIREKDNVYYEIHSSSLLYKQYYKSSKLKRESYGLSSTIASIENAERLTTDIVNFDKDITNRFNHVDKIKNTANYAIGSKSLFQEELVELIEHQDRHLPDFAYVKDDILDGRSCIIVKAYRYDTKKYYAYWIEKSTGFYVGRERIDSNATPSEPDSTIKNLSFGTVKDIDLAEPKL